MNLDFTPLQGRFVFLEPLAPHLKEGVRTAVDSDPEAWAIMPINPTGERFDAYWARACGAPPEQRLVYAIRTSPAGEVIGTSTFYMAAAKLGGVEIGTTFLRPEFRSGAANPETKLLMLSHPFAAGAIRVQFRVDSRNARSQAAVGKLGAVREGMLRKDMPTWTGYVRDTVIFSILADEWPAVRARLEARLGAADGLAGASG